MQINYLIKKYYNSEQQFQAIYKIKLENKLSINIEDEQENNVIALLENPTAGKAANPGELKTLQRQF